jgi:hypothetical protein
MTATGYSSGSVDRHAQFEVNMSNEDRHQGERGDGGVSKQEIVPAPVTDPWPDRHGTERVPQGDRVTVDPTLADEEVVPPSKAEGPTQKRTSFQQ